jgi:hypothetical protein
MLTAPMLMIRGHEPRCNGAAVDSKNILQAATIGNDFESGIVRGFVHDWRRNSVKQSRRAAHVKQRRSVQALRVSPALLP